MYGDGPLHGPVSFFPWQNWVVGQDMPDASASENENVSAVFSNGKIIKLTLLLVNKC